MSAPVDVTKVGPFLIERQLGRGGMGIVYAGRHETTGALAAIKTVTDADGRRMFQIRREIDALASLSHPGVVHILGHGVEAGVPWYAMDLLDGHTLEEVHRGFLEHPLRITDSGASDETTVGLAALPSAPTPANPTPRWRSRHHGESKPPAVTWPKRWGWWCASARRWRSSTVKASSIAT